MPLSSGAHKLLISVYNYLKLPGTDDARSPTLRLEIIVFDEKGIHHGSREKTSPTGSASLVSCNRVNSTTDKCFPTDVAGKKIAARMPLKLSWGFYDISFMYQ